jgi:hypothetical protein
MSDEQELARVEPAKRVLLLSHCLRPSQTCAARYNKEGLACTDDCTINCVIGRLRRLALRLGYGGVCIAPGGQLALRFVRERCPAGIVAIACYKELEEGVAGVRQLADNLEVPPAIITVPLTRDGCVDTEVDEARAAAAIRLGCQQETANKPL